MEVLKNYYNECVRCWSRRIIFIWAFLTIISCLINEILSDVVSCLVKNHTISFITQDNEKYFRYFIIVLFMCFAPTGISVVIYSGILNRINKKGWKKKFPNLDLDGKWTESTTYAKCFGGQYAERVASSPVHICQTCQNIEVKPSIGKGFEWHSIIADINNSCLEILYKVEYSDNLQYEGYPERRFGYESMHIDFSELSPKGKPCKMIGKFWHCVADDGKPMYMGDVVYERDT